MRKQRHRSASGAPIAELVVCRTLDRKVEGYFPIGGLDFDSDCLCSWSFTYFFTFRFSPRTRCCILEQETSSPLLLESRPNTTESVNQWSYKCSPDYWPGITTSINQRTNGPVNALLISWPSKAQNIQNLENIW